MELPRGEGAVSIGPLVAVLRAGSERDARAVVELLEAHEIPALLDLDFDRGVLPFRHAPQPGAAHVLVPMTMARAAQSILRGHEDRPPRSSNVPEVAPFVPREPDRRASASAAVPAIVPARPAVPPVDVELDEEDDDAPIEVPLPEPAPLYGRLALALGAILFGTVGQRLLELALGPAQVRQRFGARLPLSEEPWRLFTAGFLHGGISHFASNAAFGVLMGAVLFGTHLVGAAAFVWLVSSAAGIGAELLMSPGVLVVGASAGNYGLVGLWTSGQLQRARVSTLPRREIIRTMGLLLLLVPGALTPFSSSGTRIAIVAHAVGFLAGAALGTVFHRRLDPSGFAQVEHRSRLAGAAVLVLGAVALIAAAARQTV